MQSSVAKDANFDKMGGRSVPWLAREKLVVAYFVVISVVRIILRVVIRILSCVKPSYLSILSYQFV